MLKIFNLKLIGPLVFAVGVGAFGTYQLLQSEAYSRPVIVLPLPGEAADESASTRGVLNLEDGALNIVGSIPARPSSPPYEISMNLSGVGHNDMAQFEFTRYVQSAGFNLSSYYDQVASSNPSASSVTPFDVCFNIDPSRFGQKNILLGTLFMNVTYPHGESRWKPNHGYMSIGAFFAQGTCKQQIDKTWPATYGHGRGPQMTIGNAKDAGPGPGGTSGGGGTGSGFTGSGENGVGTGTSPSPSPGSGGGGSSTAQKQSNAPNPIPTASPQGDASEQPDIEPSPFFDGKDYDKGSDSDSFGSSISKTGTKLIHSWYYVVGAIVLGGVGGLGYWIWKSRAKRF